MATRYFLCKHCDDESDNFICKLTTKEASAAKPTECPWGNMQADWAEVDQAEFDLED